MPSVTPPMVTFEVRINWPGVPGMVEGLATRVLGPTRGPRSAAQGELVAKMLLLLVGPDDQLVAPTHR